ncbi:MAG: hypothetical protein AAF726_12760 [Planctomycetota bacterium]
MSSERPIPRQSVWERKRAAWYRDAARSDVQESAGALPFFLGLGAAAAFGSAWDVRAQPIALIWCAVGVIAVALMWGLLTGREWARRVGGTFAAVVALLSLLGLAVALVRGEAGGLARVGWHGVIIFAWIGIAFELLGAESARRLHRARAILDGEEPAGSRTTRRGPSAAPPD